MSSKTLVFVGLSAAILALCVLALQFPAKDGVSLSTYVNVLRCKLAPDDVLQEECVFRIIELDMREKNTASAMSLFFLAERLFERSLDYNCHAAAHRVGDIAYYRVFRADPRPEQYTLSRKDLVCQGGFIHGFFEHMVQERPDPGFISETCGRFEDPEKRLGDPFTAACFHAAGHGLAASAAARLTPEAYGDPNALLSGPVRLCEAMPGASPFAIYMCQTGIMGSFLYYNWEGEYGFSKESDKLPMGACDLLPSSLHPQCDYMRGAIRAQRDNSYAEPFARCVQAELGGPRFVSCLEGALSGVFASSIFSESLPKAIALCREDEVVHRGLEETCFESLVQVALVTYPLDGVRFSCKTMPSAHREICESAVTTALPAR